MGAHVHCDFMVPQGHSAAALSTVALEYVEANLNPDLDGEELYNEQKARGMLLLNIAVLSIVMTAPLCGALMGILGPRLLEKENSLETEQGNSDANAAVDINV